MSLSHTTIVGKVVRSTTVPRTATWRSALVLALGASLLVVVSVGPMAVDLGPAMVVVWIVTALVGGIQCLLLADLGRRFPHKAGGTATYAHEAFQGMSPLLGAASAWGYWFAWTPGIAVNLLLAARYLTASVLPGMNELLLAAVLALILYGFNALGLQPSMRMSAALAVCALVPLAAIAIAPLIEPSLVRTEHLVPFVPRDGSWSDSASWQRMIKWMFVAAWSSYGAEMASTVVAELRDPRRDTAPSLIGAAVVALIAYGAVPLALLGLVGADALADDPAVVLLPAAQAIFGPTGAAFVTVLLVAALLLGAFAFVIGSSRTLYQMSRDGLMIRQCMRLNRRGVPVGAMIFDATVTLALLAIFQARLLDIVAAANVGYMLVFVLLPLAWLRLRRLRPPDGFQLPHWFVPIAYALCGFNLVLLVVGGAQWGPVVVGVGLIGTLAFVPFYWVRRLQDKTSPIAH